MAPNATSSARTKSRKSLGNRSCHDPFCAGVNPGSVVLSGEMMLRYMGWTEAADLIIKGMDGAITARTVTYDFARQMDAAKEVKCSEFGTAVIEHM